MHHAPRTCPRRERAKDCGQYVRERCCKHRSIVAQTPRMGTEMKARSARFPGTSENFFCHLVFCTSGQNVDSREAIRSTVHRFSIACGVGLPVWFRDLRRTERP